MQTIFPSLAPSPASSPLLPSCLEQSGMEAGCCARAAKLRSLTDMVKSPWFMLYYSGSVWSSVKARQGKTAIQLAAAAAECFSLPLPILVQISGEEPRSFSPWENAILLPVSWVVGWGSFFQGCLWQMLLFSSCQLPLDSLLFSQAGKRGMPPSPSPHPQPPARESTCEGLQPWSWRNVCTVQVLGFFSTRTNLWW